MQVVSDFSLYPDSFVVIINLQDPLKPVCLFLPCCLIYRGRETILRIWLNFCCEIKAVNFAIAAYCPSISFQGLPNKLNSFLSSDLNHPLSLFILSISICLSVTGTLSTPFFSPPITQASSHSSATNPRKGQNSCRITIKQAKPKEQFGRTMTLSN